jgi:hypothetical protein
VIYLLSLKPQAGSVDLNNTTRNAITAVYLLVLSVAAGLMFQAKPELFNAANEVCPIFLMFTGIVVLPYSLMPN